MPNLRAVYFVRLEFQAWETGPVQAIYMVAYHSTLRFPPAAVWVYIFWFTATENATTPHIHNNNKSTTEFHFPSEDSRSYHVTHLEPASRSRISSHASITMLAPSIFSIVHDERIPPFSTRRSWNLYFKMLLFGSTSCRLPRRSILVPLTLRIFDFFQFPACSLLCIIEKRSRARSYQVSRSL